MKKIFAILLAVIMILSLVACGETNNDPNKNNENTASDQKQDTQPSGENQQTSSGKTVSTEWPTNTIFPKPEGCRIVEVRSEDWKNYITVEWDNKEAAKNYIDIVKEVEGDTAEVIGQGETEESVYYGTYNITVTSMNEEENIVLYK